MSVARDVWITGRGLLSPLGLDLDESWEGLLEGRPTLWGDLMPPFSVHPLPGVPDYDRFIPRRGDQRAMGPMMLYGCVAAGQALHEAGVLGDQALLRRTHLMVGVGGGERDQEADDQILAAVAEQGTGILAERLQAELRPTLFLAQLPNLFAGNISIVFGVSGSSRTFMGQELAALDALRVAHARIAAGQGDIFLVGSAHNGARRDIALLYHAGGYLMTGPAVPFGERPQAGIALGSAGAFLVVESREHALARGARPVARLAGLRSGRGDRARADGPAAMAAAQWHELGVPGNAAVYSGACGSGPITGLERRFLDRMTSGPVHETAALLGHGVECAALSNIVLASRAVETGTARAAAVTAWGHAQGEGLVLVETAEV